VFYGSASNLVAGDANGSTDVFVRDRLNGTTECISVDPSGCPGDSSSDSGAITPDGRFVAFRSRSGNLVPGDTNGKADVFVRDRQTGTTERLSVASDGAEGDDDSGLPALTPDGRFVAFQSRATNLVGGDTNGRWDVFVHDRLLGTTLRASLDANGAEGDEDSGIRGPSLTADGRTVAFDSRAQLVPADTDAWHDIYVRELGPYPPGAYCDADPTTHGCVPTISAGGTPSVSAGSGFDVTVSSVEGGKLGLLFWSSTPALPWNMSATLLCVRAPITRIGRQGSGGTSGACDGAFSLDFNAWMAAHPHRAPAAGTTVCIQAWFRDPPAAPGASRSDALLFTVGP
jgi:WD40-like Beta Propeller Repeat